MHDYPPLMITEKLANIVASTEYEKLPEDVIKKAKLCFIDFLAVSLAGSRTPSGVKVKNIFKSGEESTVMGNEKASCIDASLINGVFAHCLDLDDGHRTAQLHPGCSVIPAALSLSEARDKSGKDLISAIVAGYQVAILMGKISNPKHRDNGFHSTGTCGTFGAAAASCKALGLEYEDIVNALGLAGTQASGLLESDHSGSMGKHLHAGKASQSGVLAALLAENNFTGSSSIIDGKEGFLKAMVYHDNDNFKEKTEKIFENSRYHILDVYIKKYPVCRHLHSSVDAAIEVHKKIASEGITVDDIESITIKTYKIASEHDNYSPETDEAIRQSLPVATTIGILKGKLNLDNLKLSPEIKSAVQKVDIKLDEEMEGMYPSKRPSDVTVITKNSHTCRVDLPMGEPEKPFDQNSLLDKFHEINPHIDLKVLNKVYELESYKIKDLMDVMNKEFSITSNM